MSLSSRLNAMHLPLGGDLLRRARGGWMQQIPPCIPERVRSWIAARRPRRVVEAAGPRAQVMRDIGGKRDPLRSLELRLPEQRLSSDSADRQRHPWVETVLELPSEAVLRRQLALPRQVRDQLHSVLGYEIDRLTPFARSEVYFDARVLDDPPGAAKLRVELAVCRRDQARDWLDTLRQAGAPADRLAWAGAWPGANLLPAGERPQRRNWGLLINAALGLLAVLLVVLLLISPLWQRQQTHQALEDQLRELRARAAEVAQVREELEQARVGSVAVLQRKADAPRMTDLLRELTDLLPDGTWVQTLNYREGEVDIRGESTQATALIALLENGPGISNVTFRSPVMQIASSGTERFHIAFTYQRPDS